MPGASGHDCIAVGNPVFERADHIIKPPTFFFSALKYAGSYGEATLNGLLPILMAWLGRYGYKLHSDYKLPGGRFTLSVLLLFTLYLIVYETLHTLT